MYKYLQNTSSSQITICSGNDTNSCIDNYKSSSGQIADLTIAYYDILDDQYYILLYLAWLDRLFHGNDKNKSSTQRVLHHLVIKFSGQYTIEEMSQAVNETIPLLPDKTAFVVFNVASYSKTLNPVKILDLRRERWNMLIHLNSEQPYDETTSCYGSESKLIEIYHRFDVVVRNYAYKPLSSCSYYVPLGPSLYHMLAAVRDHSLFRRVSERPVDCFYSGRYLYPTRYSNLA